MRDYAIYCWGWLLVADTTIQAPVSNSIDVSYGNK
jgi:hypothetical protein